jgi:hypothetical protein
MTDSLAPTPGSDPQDGDLVVTGDTSHSRRYAVRQLPGPVQFTTSTRNEANPAGQGFREDPAREHLVVCAERDGPPAGNVSARH